MAFCTCPPLRNGNEYTTVVVEKPICKYKGRKRIFGKFWFFEMNAQFRTEI